MAVICTCIWIITKITLAIGVSESFNPTKGTRTATHVSDLDPTLRITDRTAIRVSDLVPALQITGRTANRASDPVPALRTTGAANRTGAPALLTGEQVLLEPAPVPERTPEAHVVWALGLPIAAPETEPDIATIGKPKT